MRTLKCLGFFCLFLPVPGFILVLQPETEHSMSLQKEELVLNICSLKLFSSTLNLPSFQENNIFFHQGRDILGEKIRKLCPKTFWCEVRSLPFASHMENNVMPWAQEFDCPKLERCAMMDLCTMLPFQCLICSLSSQISKSWVTQRNLTQLPPPSISGGGGR